MSAENEIRDINLFGDIKSIKQDLFDAVHPIGETYVQYPQQDDPMTIYNKNGITSVWEEQLQYNGAFFRSSNALSTVWKVDDEDGYYTINGDTVTPVKVVADNGGTITIGSATASAPRTIDGKVYKEYSVTGYSSAAADYINKTNPLSIQTQSIEKHHHGNQHRHSGTTNNDEGKHTHSFSKGAERADGIHEAAYSCLGTGPGPAESTISFSIGSSGAHKHTFTSNTPINTNNTTSKPNTDDYGDTETRPINYSYIIWKRIS